MPTNTYIALDKVTLGSNQGAITFSNIPQTYTDLRLVIKGGFVDSGFTLGARVGNGSVDTSSNYSYQLIRGNGSTGTSYAKSNMVFGAVMQQGGNNLNNTITVDFLNYANTTTNKTWLCNYGNAAEGVDYTVTTWRSTAAINTISIAECGDGGSGAFNYGNMLAGTTFSLYGIRAEGQSPAPKATGGVITADSTYYYHTFASTGVFTPSQTISCDYFMVAGGGGAGATVGGGWSGGGGGGGGYRTFTNTNFTATNYTVTVGGGGSGGSGSGGYGASGGNSSVIGGAISTTTSGGGGGGTSQENGNTLTAGRSGGSGGGAPQNTAAVAGGSGNAGGYTPVEGYAGFSYTGGTIGTGQGGGAGGVGGQGVYQEEIAFNGVTAFDSNRYSSGGCARWFTGQVMNASANTGNGGFSKNDGTGTNYTGGNGGSGIVVIRYAKA